MVVLLTSLLCFAVHHKGEMAIEPAPKIFLQNKLRSCRAKMDQVGPQVQAKSVWKSNVTLYNLSCMFDVSYDVARL